MSMEKQFLAEKLDPKELEKNEGIKQEDISSLSPENGEPGLENPDLFQKEEERLLVEEEGDKKDQLSKKNTIKKTIMIITAVVIMAISSEAKAKGNTVNVGHEFSYSSDNSLDTPENIKKEIEIVRGLSDEELKNKIRILGKSLNDTVFENSSYGNKGSLSELKRDIFDKLKEMEKSSVHITKLEETEK